ncbi:MFS general substrate transporter [Lentithecium fluviatile CBS 122367]|uniref:MFS general substrate transporter n=1 Tax=Lentithecium fluviatile CBS 122367 TaxID=1168545 RepID=A0A6G1IXB1_9PLEO|nr:MFS general substrate transporter [Lentithecium fluviatile CBS 122367]
MANRGGVEEEERLLEEPKHDEKVSESTARPLEDKVTWRNLPEKKQLLLLALCRLSTPLSNACLLPYLYYLVKSILSDPEHPSASQEISRLTGLLVAAYPIGQMSTSMIWGRLSDAYGRKPVILLGLLISVTANLAFGFSRSIGMLLFWRVLAGMANGILGVMRTMTAEIVKERRYQTRAFLALPLIFNSGRVAALAIGGCLADPVHNLPWLFGPTGIFNFHANPDGVAWTVRYPYALPSLFNGAVLAICLVLATLWLRESLPRRERDRNPGLVIRDSVREFVQRRILRKADAGYTAVEVEEGDVLTADVPVAGPVSGASTPTHYKPKLHRPAFREIWTQHLLKTLLAFALLPLHNATFLHIFPVFLSMPTTSDDEPTIFRFTGGLGLASPTVGVYLATFGICGILLQLFIYPRIQKHLGTLGAFRLANSIFPIAYVFAPYLSLLAEHKTTKWLAMAAILFSQVMARTMAIPSSVILLTEAAPRRSVLGTVHGAGNTLSALASATGPVIGGILLARGINAGAVGFVWWCWLLLVALSALAWSFMLNKVNEDDDSVDAVPLE